MAPYRVNWLITRSSSHQRDWSLEFENFIDSGAWQDPSVTIVDCEDLWTIEELKSLYVPGMDMEDFEKAVISAQNSAESNDYKVWGIPYGMIQDAFDEVAY